ncbi:MAG: P1 family peptidase [Candidatus Limnocylindria bacterium]
MQASLVAGLRVGHWTDEAGRTGCTVLLFDGPTVASVDVRGGAPGSIETALLDPWRTASGVHAVVLTGGSAFGLASADGVRRWLDERGIGFQIATVHVPLVAGAVIFDLLAGDPGARPDAAAGYAACDAATREPAEGLVGAGTGATVAKLTGDRTRRGGLGIATVRAGDATVTAVMVVNAVGGIWDDETGAWAAEIQPGASSPPDASGASDASAPGGPLGPGASTTIGCVVTDALLDKPRAFRLAGVAHDGLARAVRPAHTDLDGDTIFCVSLGGDARVEVPTVQAQMAAADAVARAIVRAVRR